LIGTSYGLYHLFSKKKKIERFTIIANNFLLPNKNQLIAGLPIMTDKGLNQVIKTLQPTLKYLLEIVSLKLLQVMTT